jgi:hypothetical protein
LADSVRYDFDLRLARAQDRGLATSSERARATVESFVTAVEEALADEKLLDATRVAPDDETLASAHASAEAAAMRYEDDDAYGVRHRT